MYRIIAVTNKHTVKLHHAGSIYIYILNEYTTLRNTGTLPCPERVEHIAMRTYCYEKETTGPQNT